MLVLQNDIQRFEFIGGIRTKILFTHSSIEIPNKFWKKQEGEGFTFHFVEIFYFVEILSISEWNFYSVLRAIEI